MGACCGGASPPTAAEIGGAHGSVLSMLYAEYQAAEGSYQNAWEVTLQGVRSGITGTASGVDMDTGTKWKAFARRDLKHCNLYFGVSGSHFVLLGTPKDDSQQIHTWCSVTEDDEFNTRPMRQHFFDKLSLLNRVFEQDNGGAGGDGGGHKQMLTWERVEFIIASDGYFDQTRKFSSVWQNRASISSYQDLNSFFLELDAEMAHRKANPPPKNAGHKRYLSKSAAPKSTLNLTRV